MRVKTKALDIPESPDLTFEQALWKNGSSLVAGIDEAGRGAWAGPVVAAAVVLPAGANWGQVLNGVRDSKQMTPLQREKWVVEIKNVALAWGIGFASHAEIDTNGILPATRLAMERALENLSCTPTHLLIDAVRLAKIPLPQTALIKGDQRSLSIAAASVLAKTARDAWMVEMDTCFPKYGFVAHKGYGTRRHQAALALHGACEIHRRTYKPIMAQLEFEMQQV